MHNKKKANKAQMSVNTLQLLLYYRINSPVYFLGVIIVYLIMGRLEYISMRYNYS